MEDLPFVRSGKGSLSLDIAYPATEGAAVSLVSRPAIVFIHGGGFVSGNRQGYSAMIREAARRGFVAATVDYRLADGTPSRKFPAAVLDVATAVRWIKVHAAEYGIDPARIGIMGGSAGGNLALMVGLAPEIADGDPDRLFPDVDSRVKAVVNFCGPTDYVAMLVQLDKADPLHILSYLKGGNVRQVRASAREASPLYHIDDGEPPVLTIHGTADRIVPFENARRLDDAMKKAGLDHRLVTIPGGDHPGLSKVSYKATVEDELFRFFKEVL